MKRPNRYSKDSVHRKFGIQNWLRGKGFCMKGTAIDLEMYRLLLREFYTNQTGLLKFENGVCPEGFVDSRFNAFCSFCIKKFNKTP